MAETASSREETAFDGKRKPADPCCEAKEERSNKIQKLEVVEGEPCNDVKKNGDNGDHKQGDEQIDNISSAAEGKDDGVLAADVDAGDEGEDDDDEDDCENGEKSSGKAAKEDRKGKGIMKDDKGKGKLIEEDDDDDDDDEDSSDDGSEFDNEESDLSDDPLAEVDLDNILPSRTRRRTVHPGVYFATDLGNEDDDSSDSDA
ncbi:nucleolin-like [Cucurbita pepo subsp. pepo]|uniref:nucleolin-like n=1 Tax=Cucurbita pepo subsp. pepo TaxID=3664 RepID=UPI000C9D7263|nr:nucleolin-like [Cucurbita pepo subsp. pepo]XP_023551084.1 nucleolin-like [Cucurbita pepo subsp. pepo]XP_023551085.1 nucleolin-like [Cucurbita pepo subsp. pepo]XP_023551086.1 nucleolin-like [Cucurbita pepo subsp. pepo]